jgi:flagellar biosynthesis/type III secretory pathway protein FliH
MPNVNDLEEMNAMLAERVKTWTEEWKQQGLQEGLQQGMQQGIHRGEEKLLRRLLIRRFATLPSWVDERLAQASFAELELWADRVLDASTLEAIFSD